MSKRKIESYIIAAAVAAFISGFGAGTAAEQHTQEEAARQQSTEMVTLQIYNETQKTWDTYQGTQRAHVERFMVGITQKAIATSRAEAYRKAVQEGEKH